MPEGETPHNCPLCGGPAIDRGIAVDLNSNTVMIDGAPLRLTPKQAELLSVFAGPTFRRNTRERIIAKVWGHGAEISEHLVAVTICSLNKRLKASRYRIRGSMGRGSAGAYMLERLA